MLFLILSSNLDGFVVLSVSFAPVALLPGFFFGPAALRLVSGCVPAVFRLKLLRNCYVFVTFLLSACYVKKSSYLCIVFQERVGNAGERPTMACLMRTTEFRACVTSVPRPYFFLKIKY